MPVKLVLRIKGNCTYRAGVISVFLEGYFSQMYLFYIFSGIDSNLPG